MHEMLPLIRTRDGRQATVASQDSDQGSKGYMWDRCVVTPVCLRWGAIISIRFRAQSPGQPPAEREPFIRRAITTSRNFHRPTYEHAALADPARFLKER